MNLIANVLRFIPPGFPFLHSYGSESSPIGDLSEVCRTVPTYTYVDGDCTVPVESATVTILSVIVKYANYLVAKTSYIVGRREYLF